MLGTIVRLTLRGIALTVRSIWRLIFGPPVIRRRATACVRNPYVIDGDTIAVGRQRYRLLGIDAPEMSQGEAGPAARAHLIKLIGGGEVEISASGRDCYDRILCDLWSRGANGAEGRHLNLAMVEDGYAFATRDRDFWKRHERRARRRKAGIWASRRRIARPDQHRLRASVA
ncbi:thermonuclease family protein [Tranquillimonas alkanivorans]|nr:thermonuclease family protein [Tranquillimonas alkanivorans]